MSGQSSIPIHHFMRERLPEPNNEEQGLCHHSQPIQPWLRRCCQRGGTGRILSLGLHTQQNAVVLLNVFVIPYSGLIKHQQLFFFSVCLLCLTFKKNSLPHINLSHPFIFPHVASWFFLFAFFYRFI